MPEDEKDVIPADPSPADVNDGGAAPETPDAPETGKPAEALNTDTTPAGPGPVPYSRFQEVNTEKAELKRLLEEREADLRDFRSKQAAVPPVTANKPKFSDPATQAFYEAEIAPLVKTIQNITEFKEQQEAESQVRAIYSEIDGLIAKSFKNADKEWVVSKLIANPKSKISDLVRISHDREVAREKSIIDNYLKGKQEDAKHKAKSPAGSAPSAKTPGAKGNGWLKQLENATDGFAQRLSAGD